MQGFFYDHRTILKAEVAKKPKNDCEACGLYKHCVSPKMGYTGKGQKKILIIAEAPGRAEDEQGTQLIGEAGKFLRIALRARGIDLDRDCWKINAVNCRPPNSRAPSAKEIKCCKETIVGPAIEELKPEFIWLLGASAVQSYFLNKAECEFGQIRGYSIYDREQNALVSTLYHPAYLIRNEKDVNLHSQFNRELDKVLIDMKQPKQVRDIIAENKIHIVKDKSKIKDFLMDVKEAAHTISFDYETTGLKPHASDKHRIYSIAITAVFSEVQNEEGETSVEEIITVAFPFMWWEKWKDDNDFQEIEDLWLDILENPNIKKIAHNIKFEDMWTRGVYPGTVIQNWHFDTMIAAHILDNRRKVTGLKFQSLLKFGVMGYEESIKPFLKSPTSLGFNTIHKAPIDDLLYYNGLDALLTYHLYDLQQQELKWKQQTDAFEFFMKGLIALSDVQFNGFTVDTEYFKNENDILLEKMENIEKELRASEEAEAFKKRFGIPIKLGSAPDLRKLFYDILKLTPPKFTDGGAASVDKETIGHFDNHFSEKLLELRRLEKIRGTYLAQMMREVHNGKINPFFDLHIPTTFRSSSSSPNMQNVPIREELAKATIRKGVVPSKGNHLLEVDYGAIEVRIIGCLSQDKRILAYLHDKSTDMHRDQAIEIFKLQGVDIAPKQLKTLRGEAKNKFVFPLFYGSWFKPCAEGLWDACSEYEMLPGIKVKDHLKMNQMQFEKHVEDCEKKFWNNFQGVRNWQMSVVDQYQKKGVIRTPLGFAYQGQLSRNDCFNFPVQGTAFHCLLWSLITMNKWLKENKRTKIIGQIHDSIILDVVPDELEEIKQKLKEVMTEEIKVDFKFIICPLEIEMEMTERDEAWFYKKVVE